MTYDPYTRRTIHPLPMPNGMLPLHLGWLYGNHDFSITAGPYLAKTDREFGVCLREEVPIGMDADVHLPIADFSVPAVADLDEVNEAVFQTMHKAMLGREVYVGCMGGWGRTGMFLSLCAKVAGSKVHNWKDQLVVDPVAYVRAKYTNRAVETGEQEDYVEGYDPWPVRWRLMWAGWAHRLCR